MTSFRTDIPLQVAEVIRSLHPDLKQLIESATRAIAANPERGEVLKQELDGLRKYRIRRFRVIYAVHQKHIILAMAVGHRRSAYEELTEQLRRKARE